MNLLRTIGNFFRDVYSWLEISLRDQPAIFQQIEQLEFGLDETESDILDLIYDEVDNMLLAGDFQQVDTILAWVDVESMPIVRTLAFISISRAARSKLRNYDALVKRARRYFERAAPGRANSLLSGLE